MADRTPLHGRKRLRRGLILGLAVVVLALALSWGLRKEDIAQAPALSSMPREHPEANSRTGRDLEQGKSPHKLAAALDSRPIAPLPPLNSPLVTIAAELKARALTGDALAACRLAFELQRCGRQEEVASMDRKLREQIDA